MESLLKREEESMVDKKHVKIDVFGLKNLGNTCFFNSILQCLYACEELHRKYSTLLFDTSRNFGRVGEINLLFKKYLHNTEKCFSPKSLFSWAGKVKGAYRHFDQQDAQEFLAIILNGLIDG
jgi:ubiquitin carboxyl-terminal hydrolase 7/11